MKKLDALSWEAGVSFNCYGLRIGVRANDSSVMERMMRHLPPGWKPSSSSVVRALYSFIVGGESQRRGVRSFNLLYAGSTRVDRTMDLEVIFDKLESDMQFYVAENARTRLFVHAGVVGWGGKAIVIPGSSFSGKTTLVRKLVEAGATYYSDEYAIFDKHGRVHPYPRTLLVREKQGELPRKQPPEEFGKPVGTKPLPVGLVVVTKYHEDAKWRPQPLSKGRSVMAMFEHTVTARMRPQFALATLSPVAANALTVKSKRGEAEDLIEPILRQLEEIPHQAEELSSS